MSISTKHSLQKKKERRIGSGEGVARKEVEMFNSADEIVELVYTDICNGVSRRDCQKKLTLGEYGNKPISTRQAQFYYKAALDQLAENTDIEAKRLKDVLWSRYESLLETAIKKDDIYNAKGILDSMAKIFGLEQKTPATQVNIQNNSDVIKISFGLQQDNIQDAEILEN